MPSAIPLAALPPKPQAPEDGDCCRSDCSPCIFELYDRALADWERRCAAIAVTATPVSPLSR